MIQNIDIAEYSSLEFDCILDVRSPSEFAYSHIPKAINLAVLSDEQRCIVGTQYKKDPFSARILGASYVCENISKLLKTISDHIHPSKKVILYCAKGGQRSNSLSVILSEIGYRIYRLRGGYKSYRQKVCTALNSPPNLSFITLCGPTGSGKSEIIATCEYGIHLEELAYHLGSSFGGIKGTQPSTKMFQNSLFEELHRQERTNEKIALIECESKKLGTIILPTPLVEAYQCGFKIYIESPLEDRVKRIVQEYGVMNLEFFSKAMSKIQTYMSKNAWNACYEAFKRGDLESCARILLLEYYDKVYKPSDFHLKIKHTDIQTTLQKLNRVRKGILRELEQRG
ncbi:tRNA 2-selenouridine(34) synthase MnmH [Helicobacter monodelphidis]|uniref:tRNA 2-selenouridine(34) synthase MnmH n=1 Tax=Helicobacter sp. 15-1451 TaxID=2004995 RepID=UPI000DCCDFCF|nr:tRNA 2-selenouridine(34) synthase MnmH [Helicobacter sp. 15-1451]RAX58652.1 tRNA 2-selenouridine(34) synthase MnmH [Helicobacter sp. 15-1451]